MISVIAPTRGRPIPLQRGLASLLRLATVPTNIEFLIAVDDDDEGTITSGALIGVPLLTVLRPRRLGYLRLHEYYNELAARARGDFLFVWNDDMEMLTPRWDAMLELGAQFSIQQLRRDTVEDADCTAPVISRAVYEAVGHISFNPYVDTWISQVGRKSGVRVPRNDIVFRHLCLRDKTFDEHNTMIGIVCAPSQDLQLGGHEADLEQDAARIRAAMER